MRSLIEWHKNDSCVAFSKLCQPLNNTKKRSLHLIEWKIDPKSGRNIGQNEKIMQRDRILV